MGGYKSYHEYKSTNLPWVPEIPAGWHVRKLTHAISYQVGFTPESGNAEYYGDDYLWANISDLGPKVLANTSKGITEEAIVKYKKRPAKKGSLLYSFKLSVGQVSFAGQDMFTNEAIASFGGSEHVDLSYFYFLAPIAIIQNASENIYGAKILNQEAIGAAKILVPPMEEQRKIAELLDYKTAQIDALIAKKQALLEKLAEQRTALISQAVTKGLDPSVPMKDSGVEWMGEIPAHWTVPNLGYVAEVRGGVTKGRKLPNEETVEVPYLRVANVQDGFIDLSHVTNIEILVTELERYSLQKGDVLMNEGGDNDKLGRGAVWQGEITPCLHQNHVFAVRPRIPEFSDWLALLTQSGYAKFYFYTTAKQSTNLASISSSNIKRLPVLLPPETERREIIDHVKTSLDKLTKQRERVIQVIERLKEYRAALITNAVTGKIDVRDFRLPTTTEQKELAHG